MTTHHRIRESRIGRLSIIFGTTSALSIVVLVAATFGWRIGVEHRHILPGDNVLNLPLTLFYGLLGGLIAAVCTLFVIAVPTITVSFLRRRQATR